MASRTSNLNSLMKILELLYDPQVAQLTGTFDPLVAAGSQPGSSPLARAYMNSSNEDVARIFSGLVAGEYDPITAKQELADLNLGNLETGPLYSAVDKVMEETIGGSSSSRGGGSSGYGGDMLSKAGLPSQLETYMDNPDIAPIGKKTQKAYDSFDKQLNLLRTIAPNKKKGREGESLSTKGLDAETKNVIEGLADEEKVKLYELLDKDAISAWRNRKGVLKANAEALTKAGRTPFNDALFRRAAGLSGILGQ